jgi:hypothetical protein
MFIFIGIASFQGGFLELKKCLEKFIFGIKKALVNLIVYVSTSARQTVKDRLLAF